MMKYRIDFEARDLLYFGDGHEADGSMAGNGSNWPLPSVVNSALIQAMHRGLEEKVGEIESKHTSLNKRERQKGSGVRFSFGGTQTIGPFPVKNGKMLIPIPADLQMGADKAFQLMHILDNDGENNLPSPLTKLVAPVLPPSKEEPGSWMEWDDLEGYLEGCAAFKSIQTSEIYKSEWRMGLGIDASTQTVEDGKLYSAEYMRLEQGVALRVYASYEASGYHGKNKTDIMANAKEQRILEHITLGGQQGVAMQVAFEEETLKLPPIKPTRRLKWILLAPALFSAGWRPGFVDATGKVRLKQDTIPRGKLPRDEWRRQMRQASEINAKLVAARIPKHKVVSGWKLNGSTTGQPKASRRLVPAGSVFYFECDDDSNAKMLATVLHGRMHSDECGEQGFGFGVCGNWNNQI
ncbi:MAG: hypothetical protein IKP00_00935 [Victivallales bacterium]|nr:hypothetical protein [Victivallales bacterium]